MNKIKNNTCILAFVPNYNWNEPWQSRHQILSRLSERYKVLWISRPVYWVDILYKKRNFPKRKRLIEVSKSLFCYAPIFPADYVPPHQKSRMPGFARKVYHNIWLYIQTLVIKCLLKKMKAQKLVLYLWQPHFVEQISRFHEDLVVYHIADDYHYDSKKDHPVSEQERQIIEKSDIVFIHSKTLLEKKGHINKNTFYMPNGVDFELYRSIIENTSSLPDDILHISRPFIGYAGWIKKHLDLKLLLEIARARRDWSIVFVGPIRWNHKEIHEDIKLLQKEENVFFLGCKEIHELPVYIDAMDVCLMPYRVTPYTKYIYPLKLHEYLACGKPVVATPLPNILDFSSVLNFAQGTEDWIRAISEGLKETDPVNQERRKNVASENSWSSRVQFFVNLIEKRT
ncbi:MAG: glycosyltransferase [bacterium]